MTSITNRWKLGLFVVSSLAVGVSVLLWLGASQLQQQVEVYYVFVDEDVSGLEVGSSVKFRGVTVGSVSEIAIAPDRRAVRITCEVFTNVMQRIGLRKAGDHEEHNEQLREQAIAMGLRAQLVSAGITGTKYVQVDYFDLDRHQTLQFPFELPPRTFPSVASTVKSIETAIYALSSLPEIMDDVRDVLMNIEHLAANLDARVHELDVEGLLQSVRVQVDGLQTAGLVERVHGTLGSADALIADVDKIVLGLDEDRRRLGELIERGGALAGSLEQAIVDAHVEPTSRSIRDAAQAFVDLRADGDPLLDDASAATRELSSLLVALQGAVRHAEDTLDAVRDLAELLERDPGALLRGREQTTSPAGEP